MPRALPPVPSASSTPRGLVPALRARGIRLDVRLGTGADGDRWSALAEDGHRVVVSVVPVRSAAHRQHLQERVERLAGLDHPHLARVRGSVGLPGHEAVVHEEVAGTDLATLSSGRGAWSAGEAVTVLEPLAQALTVLHASGTTHGDVAPANVVLTPDGCPVLVDLVCGDDLLEQGTPGVAAPERSRGARPPGDVHALARVGLQLLGRGGGPGNLTAGDEPAVREGLVALLQEAASPDPDERPTAATFAEDVAAVCAPSPVAVPDAAVLARAALRRQADAADAQRTRRPAVPSRRRHRRRGPARGTLLPVAGVLAVVLGGTAAALTGTAPVSEDRSEMHPPAVPAALPVGGAADADAPEPVHPAAARPATVPGLGVPGAPVERADSRDDAVEAAIRLTHARARALAHGGLLSLMGVTVPGSAAAAADLVAWSRAVRSDAAGLHVVVLAAERVDADGGPEARVRLTARAVATVADGAGDGDGPAEGHGDGPGVRTGATTTASTTASTTVGTGDAVDGPPPTVVLVLTAVPGGWAVSAVEPDGG